MTTEGIIILHKPQRASSARYCYRLRPILGVRRVGHAGTLDPFAEGVLIACVGKATRLVEQLMGLTKVYEVGLRLGVTNVTFDTERPFESVPGAEVPTRAQVDQTLRRFEGMIAQTPPLHSAVKVAGAPAYVRVRDGQEVVLAARPVHIHGIELLAYA